MRFLLPVLFLLPSLAGAQAKFEVASVKLQPWGGQGNTRVGVYIQNDTLYAEHCTLNNLIAFAYDLRDQHLSGGPAWAGREHITLNEAELYQVVAKTSITPPPPRAVFQQMLQELLADRFQLKVRHEEKILPVFNLVIDKGGLKMKPSADDTKFEGKITSVGRFGVKVVARHVTMAFILGRLEIPSGRPVFDRTGLTGTYDFELDYSAADAADDAPTDLPSIFTAIRERLGLRLDAATAPFDTVVVEHAERPTGN